MDDPVDVVGAVESETKESGDRGTGRMGMFDADNLRAYESFEMRRTAGKGKG